MPMISLKTSTETKNNHHKLHKAVKKRILPNSEQSVHHSSLRTRQLHLQHTPNFTTTMKKYFELNPNILQEVQYVNVCSCKHNIHPLCDT